MAASRKLFCFGLGYSGQEIARQALASGWSVIGTTRSDAKAEALSSQGIDALLFNDESSLDPIIEALNQSTHVLVTAGPKDDLGDPVLARLYPELVKAAPQWVGYLSTTVVYGNHGGDWVDEDTVPNPTGIRGRRRLSTEQRWSDTGLPLHIFRLAGIYGPGRNQLVSVQHGKARPIEKPGQVFSRIHVEDIAQMVLASMEQPRAKAHQPAIYNGADEKSAPPQEVIAFAAELLGLPSPMPTPYDQADLSPMARSFYADNKRVSSKRTCDELGITLKYPTYVEGLTALSQDIESDA